VVAVLAFRLTAEAAFRCAEALGLRLASGSGCTAGPGFRFGVGLGATDPGPSSPRATAGGPFGSATASPPLRSGRAAGRGEEGTAGGGVEAGLGVAFTPSPALLCPPLNLFPIT
jgi:hypothetical protein